MNDVLLITHQKRGAVYSISSYCM